MFVLGYILKVNLPGVVVGKEGISTPGEYIVGLYQFSLVAAGVLAMGILAYHSIRYLASAGNSSVQGDAKDGITQAFWGLGLLLGAYLILTTINPDLVKLKEPGEGIEPIDFSITEGEFTDSKLELFQTLLTGGSRLFPLLLGTGDTSFLIKKSFGLRAVDDDTLKNFREYTSRNPSKVDPQLQKLGLNSSMLTSAIDEEIQSRESKK